MLLLQGQAALCLEAFQFEIIVLEEQGRTRGQAVTRFELILNLGEKAGFGIRLFQ